MVRHIALFGGNGSWADLAYNGKLREPRTVSKETLLIDLRIVYSKKI